MHQPRHDVGVLPIQHAVANASPSSWEDAIVTASGEGWLEAADLQRNRRRAFATVAQAAVGEPVAVHPVAELLSLGTERYPARPLPY